MKKKQFRPSRAAKWLLKKLYAYQDRHSIAGDIEEVSLDKYDERGYIFAYIWFWMQTVISIIQYMKFIFVRSIVMLKSYIKVALRNLKKHKIYSLINISGLTIGIASCILIILWIQDELSYDMFHENSDRIYRIATDENIGGQSSKHPATPMNISEALNNDFPEIEKYVRLRKLWQDLTVVNNDRKFMAKYVFMVDTTFFDVFTVPILHGDPGTALSQQGTCVLSRSSAVKYFGEENVVGKTITVDRLGTVMVAAVAEDLPKNSHFHFDIIVPVRPSRRPPSWLFALCHTYILLKDNVSPDQLVSKFPDMVKKYYGPEMKDRWNTSYEEFTASGGYIRLSLQPLSYVHLNSNLDFELEQNGDVRYIYIFLVSALFILLIACINYMNLVTAKSAGRMKEIAVRKVVGSHKSLLIKQFLTESVLFSLISGVSAVILIELLIPYFNNLSGKQLELGYFSNPFVILLLALTMIIIGILAGIYPALFLSAFKPVSLFKGTLTRGIKSSSLRNTFVSIQMATSIILIICTLVVSQQLKYILERDLGFKKENLLVISNASRSLGENWDAFKNDVLQNPDIIHVGGSSSVLGEILSSEVFYPEGKTAQDGIYFWRLFTDHEILETMQMEVINGRFFSQEFSTDSRAVVINETGAERLGWADPIGKQISMVNNVNLTIVGVVKDFHFHSLYKEIEPLAIILNGRTPNLMLIRTGERNLKSSLEFVEEKWKQYTSESPFQYTFIESNIENIYRTEQSTKILFSIFSALGIFLACMGLLSMAAIATAHRIKEIGIRKVYGASVSNLVLLLTKKYTSLLIIANIMAWPTAWYIMNKWLEIFSYKTEIEIWMFVVSAVLISLLSLITVSTQTIKASYSNPIDSLRYE
ncbi:MAG: FtsX-like permease family protein [bacterium]|nr:FtsX-like permease family protein [bacterium]